MNPEFAAVAPVFLLASERSGTNLLRRRLTEWQSEVFGPSPTHLLKHLNHGMPFYGPLSDDGNFRELIVDALSLCYEHFSPWGVQFTPEGVLQGYSEHYGAERTLVLLLHYLNVEYARSVGFRTYFCKDNHLFHYAFEIRNDLPTARFVYLHRDPRDYVLSQINRPLGRSSITRAARLWREEQLQCLRVVSNRGFEKRVYRLSYEQLLADEQQTIAGLCQFLQVPMNAQRKDAGQFDTGTSADWKNLAQPTMKDNAGKYRTALGRGAVQAIEAITWRPMNFLGYAPEAAERPSLSAYYNRVEPAAALARDAVRRPFRMQGESEGQSERVENLRRLRAKF